MAEHPVRIALLARAGDAREQLRRALTELGAELVAEGDPGELDPQALAALKPNVILISLDPASEDVLDRFADVLAAQDTEVMFDDAEVTRHLDGWDLARWARHLAAKLLGSDLLPPAPIGAESLETTDYSPVPGAPPTPAQLMDDARLEDYAAEAGGLAGDVPSTPSLANVELPDSEAGETASEIILEEPGLDVDLSMLELAMNATGAGDDPASEEAAAVEMHELDPELSSKSFGDLAAAASEELADENFSLDVDLEGLERSLAQGQSEPESMLTLDEFNGDAEGLLIDVDVDNPEPVSFSTFSQGDEDFSGDLDADVAALASSLEGTPEGEGLAFSLPEPELPAQAASAFDLDVPGLADPELLGPDAGLLDIAEPDAADADVHDAQAFEPMPPPLDSAPETQTDASAQTAPPAASSFGSLELSLADDESPTTAARVAPAAPASPTGMFAGLSLSLEGDEPAVAPAVADAPAVPGLALVLAGMGGPDAVRQLLAALPKSLPVPLVLYQHLENGKYDRLAVQLGKGNELPVALAEPGSPLLPGHIAVLPKGLGIENDGAGFRFAQSGSLADMVAQLPAKSAVLLLSGADADLVPALLAAKSAGVTLLTQTPDSCYDATAAQAALAAGATAATPAELALNLSMRW